MAYEKQGSKKKVRWTYDSTFKVCLNTLDSATARLFKSGEITPTRALRFRSKFVWEGLELQNQDFWRCRLIGFILYPSCEPSLRCSSAFHPRFQNIPLSITSPLDPCLFLISQFRRHRSCSQVLETPPFLPHKNFDGVTQ